ARAADGAVPADGWAGLYLGGSVGGHITTNDWTTSALTAYDFVRVNDATARADLGRTAARIGVYGGVNIPVTDRILLGIEVDVAGTPGGDNSR
ncbi:hypothetical protein, partial [Enterococcus faecium]|uniref:hypothetical protein n=1 Tax=Enterococcus faecium TaxID=1352 RepID=UPI0034E94BA8